MSDNTNKKNSKKNTATKTNKKATKTTTPKASNGAKVGRPRYVPTFPTAAEWTMRDFMIANDVNPDTGKGPRCSKLTLIKFIDKDAERMGHSLVKRLSKLSEPVGEGGLGRKPFVYTLRVKKSAPVAAPADATPADVTETAAETPTGDVTVTVAEITPTAPAETSPEVAPEATPAPAEAAPVA